MKIRILAVLLTLVPFVADGAERSGSARVGVNRVAAAGQRMPTMVTKISGNKSVNTPSDSGNKNDSEEEEDFVPDDGAGSDDGAGDDFVDEGGDDEDDKVVDSKPAGSKECREAYRECMDEFCLLDESEGYRCACSSNINKSKS